MPRKTEEDEPSAPALAPRYLKLDDVAAYLSVSVPQVYSLVRSGELPAIKIGAAASGGSTGPSSTPTSTN